MNNKIMRKDFYMEVRRSPGRFLSIFLIVAMGVAFFSGNRSAQPDMLYTGDSYFDEHRLMDIKVISTLGITESDLEALEEVDGVELAEGGYSVDALSKGEENQKVLHIMSMLPTMNEVDVEEGRMPVNEGECLVDDRSSYQVGDLIWVESGTDTSIKDTLKTDEWKVVGKASSSCYISLNRGSAMIGTGSVSAFVIVPEETFKSEVYTEAYLLVEGADELEAFSDDYEERVDEVIQNIEDITGLRGEIRRNEIVDDANLELDKARKELTDGKWEAENKLADALNQITEGENQLQDAKQQITEGENLLAEAKTTLDEKQKELDDAKEQYESGRRQLEDGKAAYSQGMESYNQGLEEYNSNLAVYKQKAQEYQQAEEAYAAGEAEYQQGKASYEEQKAIYEPMIQAGRESLSVKRAELDAGWDTYYQMAESEDVQVQQQAELLKQQLDEAEEAYRQGEAEITGYQQELDSGAAILADSRAQLDATRGILDGAKSELDAGKAQLDEAYNQLLAAKAELDGSRAQLQSGEEQLDDAYRQLQDGQMQLDDGRKELKTQEDTLKEAKSEIAEKEPELADAKRKYEEGKKESEEEITDGEQKIADAEKELSNVGEAVWYVYDRSVLPEYSGYGENADRMKAIGEVFPVLFFLVAALISLTSMTRMVEEQRTQIGTMKALGYGRFAIASKYLGYALAAALGGSVLGILVGEKVIPYIIIYAYGIIYPYMNDILVPYNMYYAVMATVAATACTLAATGAACYRELGAQPAVLMRPPSPKSGKRVFMERITFIWKHLSFTWKSTIRNLFRYKKRFFMTVFGIGGCMGLMLFAFGLKDSIYEIADIQYEEIQIYDGMAYLQENVTEEEKENLSSYIEEEEGIKESLDVNMRTVTLVHDSKKREAYQTVPEDLGQIDEFVKFHDRVSKEEYTLGDDGVILSEKTAKMLDVKEGDTIEIEDTDFGNHEVKVANICENYMGHYMYMSRNLYEEIYDEEFTVNCIYFKTVGETNAKMEETGEKILKQDAVLNVSYLHDIEQQLNDMLKSLNLVVIVLIVSAGMLAFVVLYNLNNINITERRRELATLKVLGFYDGEVSAYVYRENIILTFVGMAAGIVIGILLHRFIIETVEVDSAMFGRIIDFSSYIYSMLFTLGFSFFVNGVMYFKLKKIDMVESLKSVE